MNMNQMNNVKKTRRFPTLIELMIVVAIIGIFGHDRFKPAYQTYTIKAKISEVVN